MYPSCSTTLDPARLKRLQSTLREVVDSEVRYPPDAMFQLTSLLGLPRYRNRVQQTLKDFAEDPLNYEKLTLPILTNLAKELDISPLGRTKDAAIESLRSDGNRARFAFLNRQEDKLREWKSEFAHRQDIKEMVPEFRSETDFTVLSPPEVARLKNQEPFSKKEEITILRACKVPYQYTDSKADIDRLFKAEFLVHRERILALYDVPASSEGIVDMCSDGKKSRSGSNERNDQAPMSSSVKSSTEKFRRPKLPHVTEDPSKIRTVKPEQDFRAGKKIEFS